MDIGRINFGTVSVPQSVKIGVEDWPVPPAKDAESSSPITSHSPRPEPEEILTRLGRLEEIMATLLQALVKAEERGNRTEAHILKFMELLAEDQDPDDMPATYLDGSKV